MPIYEYFCEKCHETNEVLQKVGEEAPKKCPQCGASATLKKIVSNSAFHLKGGGWYKDLYSSTKSSETTSSSKKADDGGAKVQDKKDEKP